MPRRTRTLKVAPSQSERVVEWDSVKSIENAKAAVMALHAQTKFNPQEMFARIGIKADLATYRQIGA